MVAHRRQLFVLGLAVLSFPVWWWLKSSIDLNTSDPREALKQLEHNAYDSDVHGLAKWKARWDMSHHVDEYADLVVKAGETRLTGALEPLPHLIDAQLGKALIRRYPTASRTARGSIGAVFNRGFVTDDGVMERMTVLLLSDPDESVRNIGIANASLLHSVPEALKALLHSKDKHVVMGTMEAIAGGFNAQRLEILKGLAKSPDPEIRAQAKSLAVTYRLGSL